MNMFTGSGKASARSLLVSFENRLFHQVKGNYPMNWDEDFITRSVLNQMKSLFHRKRFRLPGNLLRTRWQQYRLAQDIDTPVADFALLFSILYHDGFLLEGAAFVMARAKDPDKNTFSGLRKDHLKKMHSVAPSSQLLLYDYDAVTGMAFPSVPDAIRGAYPHTWDNWVPYSHAAVIPSSTALALGSKTTALYKASLPLSYQLCFRWFFGLDLDFGNPAMDVARGKREDRGLAKYLVCVSVSHGGGEPVEEFSVNRDLYTETV
ncbi:MAG TPA: hypothetical protein ENN21_00385 [Spirochaetes bacterium]|nr:hypothetical protein [Spirochaetota bacterium]